MSLAYSVVHPPGSDQLTVNQPYETGNLSTRSIVQGTSHNPCLNHAAWLFSFLFFYFTSVFIFLFFPPLHRNFYASFLSSTSATTHFTSEHGVYAIKSVSARNCRLIHSLLKIKKERCLTPDTYPTRAKMNFFRSH
ncbi:hypothetical protein BDV41DRAFT_97260 [Aspergillus transmontanensis]|uniref:Uncharacterized protein n=1 Tax=Aspergillus transmontanensis TaxID=1034304 RepID=A0A5N6W7D2_9EURO|nr:hypothetical protein BDV41DRAFT_97260 [Aspergillus transmontanensis]